MGRAGRDRPPGHGRGDGRAADGAAYVALNRRSRRFHAGLASPPREPAAFRACAWRSVRCGSTASRRTFSRGTGRQSRW